MKITWKTLVGFGALAAFLKGCYMFKQPGAITNFLTGGNEQLANALARGSADWARYGLEIANYVTIDDGNAGLTVRFAKNSELAVCPEHSPDKIGCTHWEMGDWMEMLIDERIKDDPEKLSYIVQHELIHALVPKAPHYKGQGIFTENYTTNYITRGEMKHLSKYTEVTDTTEVFLEDVTQPV